MVVVVMGLIMISAAVAQSFLACSLYTDRQQCFNTDPRLLVRTSVWLGELMNCPI